MTRKLFVAAVMAALPTASSAQPIQTFPLRTVDPLLYAVNCDMYNEQADEKVKFRLTSSGGQYLPASDQNRALSTKRAPIVVDLLEDGSGFLGAGKYELTQPPEWDRQSLITVRSGSAISGKSLIFHPTPVGGRPLLGNPVRIAMVIDMFALDAWGQFVGFCTVDKRRQASLSPHGTERPSQQ